MADPIDRARTLAPEPVSAARLRRGEVVTVSPLTVTIAGSTVAVPARRLANYAPTVDDQVSVLEQGTDLLVIGALTEGPWPEFTPVITQGIQVARTVTYARYTRHGRMVTAQCRLDITSPGTAGQVIQVAVPVTAARAGNVDVVGVMAVYDSGGDVWSGVARMVSPGLVECIPNGASNGIGPASGSMAALTIGPADVVAYSIQYEAAS